MKHPRSVSVKQYADAEGVDVKTVRRWIKSGLLDATRKGPRGHYRIPWGEYRKVIEGVKDGLD